MVRDVMREGIVTLLTSTTWREAAGFLLENHLSAVPVVDGAGVLVGILSEKDLFRGLYPSYKHWITHPESYTDFNDIEQSATDVADRAIELLMEKRVLTTTPDTLVLKIGALMVASGIHQVPVLEENKLVGMVSRGEIYRAILQKYFSLG